MGRNEGIDEVDMRRPLIISGIVLASQTLNGRPEILRRNETKGGIMAVGRDGLDRLGRRQLHTWRGGVGVFPNTGY